jgi:urease accessory protein
MAWHAKLELDYGSDVQSGTHKTIVQHRHTGPLRILQSLYPEGDGICHNILVHPPGGLVGGDTLEMLIKVGKDSHGLITTPGATRFYRSRGELALQQTSIHIQPGGRLEWLPLENIAYSDCFAENKWVAQLDAGAEMMGWDVTALGLPAANQPFAKGQFLQHTELTGAWLERGLLAALDTCLLESPLGLAGHRCLASIFFLTSNALTRPRKEKALEAARAIASQHTLAASIGVTSPQPQVLVARVLSPLVESAMDALRKIRAVWRSELWGLPNDHAPRIWST